MITALEKIKEEHKETIDQITEFQEDILLKKTEITFKALGLLLNRLVEVSDDLLEVSVKKDYFDKDLSKTLKETISEAITAFSKINPPTINVAPKINVDLKPIQNAFTEISKQNQSILSLIEKMYNGNKSDELYRLIVALVSKENAFLEKSFEQIDYTKTFEKISDGVNKKATEWEAAVTEWSNSGGISKMKFKVTK